MADLFLIQGPAGAGKGDHAKALLESGSASVWLDLTRLWVALSGVERGPDGRYRDRQNDEDALRLAQIARSVMLDRALQLGMNTIVTASSPQEARYREVADRHRARFDVVTIDPGRAVVSERLSVGGVLSPQCEAAIGRWYDR